MTKPPAICIPYKARQHTSECDDCVRRATERQSGRQWQYTPLKLAPCPSKIKGVK